MLEHEGMKGNGPRAHDRALPSKRVSEKEAKDLMARAIREEFGLPFPTYRLDSGAVLLQLDTGEWRIHPLHNIEIMQAAMHLERPVNSLRAWIPDDQSFIIRAPALALAFQQAMTGAPAVTAGLDDIARFLDADTRLFRSLTPERFQQLVAYFGEGLRSKIAGVTWAADDNGPMLVSPKGTFQPYAPVLHRVQTRGRASQFALAAVSAIKRL